MSSSVGVKALAPRHLDQQAGEGGHTLRFAHPTALALGAVLSAFRGRWDRKLRREVTYPRVVPANAGTHTA